MQTLEQFLANPSARNAYVKHPGFRSLYIRYTQMCLGRTSATEWRYARVLQIANIEAKKPGKGAFKRLMKQLESYRPLYVECVHNQQFANGLRKMGFRQFTDDPSFILD